MLTPEAVELNLHIHNTRALCDALGNYARLLERKRAKGIYDPALARKGAIYTAEMGARSYSREFSVGTDWARIFPPAVRREVAGALVDYLENEWACGNSWTREGAV